MSGGFRPNIYATNRVLAIFYQADCVVLHQSIQIYQVLLSSPHFELKVLGHVSPMHPFPTLSRRFHVCSIDSSFFGTQHPFLSGKVPLPFLWDVSLSLLAKVHSLRFGLPRTQLPFSAQNFQLLHAHCPFWEPHSHCGPLNCCQLHVIILFPCPQVQFIWRVDHEISSLLILWYPQFCLKLAQVHDLEIWACRFGGWLLNSFIHSFPLVLWFHATFLPATF